MMEPCLGCPYGESCLAVIRGHKPLCGPMYSEIRSLHAAGQLGAPIPKAKIVKHVDIHVEPTSFVRGVDQTSDKVRVGLVAPTLVVGGAETWQVALARSTPDIDWVGCAITLPSYVDIHRKEELEEYMPTGIGMESTRNLAANCDVLLCWADIDYEELLDGIASPPKVVYCQHIPDGGFPSNGVDQWVAVSESARLATGDPASCRVIGNAVDQQRLECEKTREEVRDGWGIPSDATVVGYIGRLANEKNPLAMVELARLSGINVVIVGDGELRRQVEKAARGVPNCRVVGATDYPGEALSAIDWLVSPSRHESYGLSIAEALWCGVPVISTDTGIAQAHPGLCRVVQDARAETLLAAIRSDSDDVDGTFDRVDRARKWVEENASLEIFGRRWTELIKETHALSRI